MPEFDQWWNDPKKHCKRLDYWLPHWRALASRARAASGIMSAGITAGARGASAGLGQAQGG